MRTLLRIAALFLLLTTAAAAATTAAPLADHVVLISVDGFRPDFYLHDDWPTPVLDRLVREGSYAERVRSVFPSVTYPSHTAMVTGALPVRHGVYYNTPFEPQGQTGRWYWEFSAVRVPTLWQAVREAGGTSAAFSWPVTVGAPIDWLVPEVWALEGEDRMAPMREESRPAGLWQEIEREATGRLSPRTFGPDWIGRDGETGQAAAWLLETYRPSLLAVHVIGPDHFQHDTGRESELARMAVAAADRAIGLIVEAAERAGIAERTAILVTGDHGFVNTHTSIAPNVWLAGAGLRSSERDRGDWRATFHAVAGAAFLHLAAPDDEEALAEVRRILTELPERERRGFRIVEREEIAALGGDPSVPLALTGELGYRFSSRAEGEALTPSSGGTHGYAPADFPEIYTGLVAWGAGITPGMVVHDMALEDVAPLIACLLGIDFEAPDGVAPLGLLAEATSR